MRWLCNGVIKTASVAAGTMEQVAEQAKLEPYKANAGFLNESLKVIRKAIYSFKIV